MKHLHEKNEQYPEPDVSILDTFTNPGIDYVELVQREFTSVCPLTHQPDYAEVRIYYNPGELCLESKSLKLYLASYRNVGAFAETIARRILKDLTAVLNPKWISVQVTFVSRGGITITARGEKFV